MPNPIGDTDYKGAPQFGHPRIGYNAPMPDLILLESSFNFRAEQSNQKHKTNAPAVSGDVTVFQPTRSNTMKILTNSETRSLKEAINLTPHCECSILKINNHTFGFCALDSRHPYLVIESKIFGLLMRRLKDRIAHYKAFRPKCMCCDDNGKIIIRVTEIDGFVYQVHEDDTVEMCMDIEKLHNGDYEKN